ncbi:DUF1090 domain-containing protein [Pseudomonas sp. M30-35]|uniref:DUF1090 domain-containing protein n=1 Tax=Pseudomonas sp. M30-35 TaxID=1981174 RepID=UPI000B3D1B58|nr:DUF1090 domain-containing protein [Pseudomonas sp. M30-35]ARU88631.1 hypothetical protein B9K09_11935 [Pseudomonas sp. M30-35]
MKFLTPFAMLSLCSLLAVPVMAAEEASEALKGCAAKKQNIIEQIEFAKSHGNTSQQAGLEKALSEVTEHCTDESLKKSREEDVLDAKHEVSERKADLEQAMKKGDIEKINKRKEKLAEAHEELNEALKELDK